MRNLLVITCLVSSVAYVIDTEEGADDNATKQKKMEHCVNMAVECPWVQRPCDPMKKQVIQRGNICWEASPGFLIERQTKGWDSFADISRTRYDATEIYDEVHDTKVGRARAMSWLESGAELAHGIANDVNDLSSVWQAMTDLKLLAGEAAIPIAAAGGEKVAQTILGGSVPFSNHVLTLLHHGYDLIRFLITGCEFTYFTQCQTKMVPNGFNSELKGWWRSLNKASRLDNHLPTQFNMETLRFRAMLLLRTEAEMLMMQDFTIKTAELLAKENDPHKAYEKEIQAGVNPNDWPLTRRATTKRIIEAKIQEDNERLDAWVNTALTGHRYLDSTVRSEDIWGLHWCTKASRKTLNAEGRPHEEDHDIWTYCLDYLCGVTQAEVRANKVRRYGSWSGGGREHFSDYPGHYIRTSGGLSRKNNAKCDCVDPIKSECWR